MFAGATRGIPSVGDLSYKAPCRLVTLVPLPANTRTGMVLLANVVGLLVVDGLNMVAGDRLIVRNEVNQVNNGIFDVLDAGSGASKWQLRRSSDFDSDIEVQAGSIAWVQAGTVNKSFYVQTATGAIGAIPRINVDNLVFSQLQVLLDGNAPIVQVFTANGTYTPNAAIKSILVEVVGGGGGGGGCALTAAGQGALGGNGGGGGYARKSLVASILSGNYAVVVGTGGAGGVAGAANGAAGNLSSFAGAGIATIQGGGGGLGGGQGSTVAGIIGGGAGGAAVGGDINIPGGSGTNAMVSAGVPFPVGHGGGSTLSQPNRMTANFTTGANGAPGQGIGTGGTGGSNGAAVATARSGGAGTDGVVIVTEFYGP